jgi:hypothetical protein
MSSEIEIVMIERREMVNERETRHGRQRRKKGQGQKSQAEEKQRGSKGKGETG